MQVARLMVVAFALSLLALTGCDKVGGAMKSVTGKVAGQVMSSSGHGRGYVSVILIPADGSENFMTTAEESGSFMFDEIPPGEYKIIVKRSGEDSDELPSDTPTIKLGPGRTLNQTVTLTDVAPAS